VASVELVQMALAGAGAALLSEGVSYTRALRARGFQWPADLAVGPVVAAIIVNMLLAALAVVLAHAGDAVTTTTGALLVGFAFPKALETFFGSVEPSPLPLPVVQVNASASRALDQNAESNPRARLADEQGSAPQANRTVEGGSAT
jgi:hypothetical protein